MLPHADLANLNFTATQARHLADREDWDGLAACIGERRAALLARAIADLALRCARRLDTPKNVALLDGIESKSLASAEAAHALTPHCTYASSASLAHCIALRMHLRHPGVDSRCLGRVIDATREHYDWQPGEPTLADHIRQDLAAIFVAELPAMQEV